MTVKINEELIKERATAQYIQSMAEKYIEGEGLSTEVIAEMLGLLPGGVDRLRDRRWTLETAWRVAETLGLDIRCTISVNRSTGEPRKSLKLLIEQLREAQYAEDAAWQVHSEACDKHRFFEDELLSHVFSDERK